MTHGCGSENSAPTIYSRSADIEMDGKKLLQQQLVQRHMGNSHIIM